MSNIGTPRNTSRRSEILMTSLIMLRSLIRFQLAPPARSLAFAGVSSCALLGLGAPLDSWLLRHERQVGGRTTEHPGLPGQRHVVTTTRAGTTSKDASPSPPLVSPHGVRHLLPARDHPPTGRLYWFESPSATHAEARFAALCRTEQLRLAYEWAGATPPRSR
jgi:hypothetical protein